MSIDDDELKTYKFLMKKAIKCCSWFDEHVKPPKKGQKGKLTEAQLEYLSNLDQSSRVTMLEFPIYCVVQSGPSIQLAFPYDGVMAVVVGYKNGFLLVRDKPDGDRQEFIPPQKLYRVANWRGITGKQLKRLVDWHVCKKQKISDE